MVIVLFIVMTINIGQKGIKLDITWHGMYFEFGIVIW